MVGQGEQVVLAEAVLGLRDQRHGEVCARQQHRAAELVSPVDQRIDQTGRGQVGSPDLAAHPGAGGEVPEVTGDPHDRDLVPSEDASALEAGDAVETEDNDRRAPHARGHPRAGPSSCAIVSAVPTSSNTWLTAAMAPSTVAARPPASRNAVSVCSIACTDARISWFARMIIWKPIACSS